MRFFCDIIRDHIHKNNLSEQIRENYEDLFKDQSDSDDESEEANIFSRKAYGLFEFGDNDLNDENILSRCSHPVDLMEDFSFEERSLRYEPVIEELLYKKVIREGSGQLLKEIPLAELAIQFHCSIYIPGVNHPIVTTYSMRLPPTILVKKLVRGFILAIHSMRANERSEFLISSKILFGSLGNSHFPPETDLIVVIDLCDIAVPSSENYFDFLPSYLRENIDGEQAFHYAQRCFREAKASLKRLEFNEAVGHLMRSRFYCERVYREDIASKWFQFKTLHTAIYMTLASTHYKLEEYHRCIKVLKILKRHMHHDLYSVSFLEGCAFEELGSYKFALNSFKLSFKVFPCHNAWNAILRLNCKVDMINLNTF